VNDISQISWIEATEMNVPKEQHSYFDTMLQLLNVQDDRAGWPDQFGDALYSWARNTLATPIRILSLFSGGGGLDVAFRDAGFHAIQMIELDARYVETLTVNAQAGQRFEGSLPRCMDIRDFSPLENSPIDFIIGGPPCQTFSAAGRRASGVSGLDDPRGNLFREYVHILGQLKPRGFLFENVYGIIGAQGGKAWEEILHAFQSLGYTISYRILDTADYGVPQHRERLIIVGTREKPFQFPRPTHGPDSSDQRQYYIPGLAIQGVMDNKPKEVGGRHGYLLKDIPPGLNYSFYTEEMGHPTPHFSWRSKFSDYLYKAAPDMPIRTLKAQGGQYTGPFHWENRAFSIDELKRLQTFPDSYLLVGGQLVATQQIGNSVPPHFARMLAIAVLEQVFDVRLPFKLDYLLPQEELNFRQRKASLTSVYRQRAQAAITKLYSPTSPDAIKKHALSKTTSSLDISRDESYTKYTAYLSPQFLWQVKGDSNSNHPWNVSFSVCETEECLRFCVENGIGSRAEPAIEVEVSPTDRWGLVASRVFLVVQEPSLLMLTAAWKAFDYYLATRKIKADTVQLNGYYTYVPKIAIKVLRLECPDVETAFLWQALAHTLAGRGVRQLCTLSHISKLWELPIEKTIEALMTLKTLGYEIRSEYTNGQIPKGYILIPYAFPTLKQNSVQLGKKLFPSLLVGQQEAILHKDSVSNEGLWQVYE